ncbi:MAG: molybdopterin biosynthesis protein [Gammaproteobacteria bacterium]|nr:MAG: molybdopterin biosynthesis protein [Gammaproteobacteria bacterium]
MLSRDEHQRYARQITLPDIGEVGQVKLKRGKVLVIGAGGLGCAVLPALVAAGVGEIGLVDADVVSLSNLQRQPLYGVDSIGRAKVEVAKQRLSRLNPHVALSTFPVFLNSDNAETLIAPYDIVVDACDNLATRYAIDAACLQHEKPWVHGAVAGFVGQVSVFNYRGSGTYRGLYPNELADEERQTDTSPLAVLGVLPAVIGALQANEVIKILCELEGVLAGRLLTYDLRTLSQRILCYRPIADSLEAAAV